MPNVTSLALRSPALLYAAAFETLPWAFAGAALVSAALLLAVATRGALTPLPLAAFVVAHAAFVLLASRVVAQQIDPALVQPLTPRRWLGGTLFLSLLIGGAEALLWFSHSALLLLPVAALSWTPLLPALALQGGTLSDAGAAMRKVPLRFVPLAVLLSLPYFGAVALIGHALSGMDAGLMDGGVFVLPLLLPLLGALLFAAVLSAALVSTLTYVGVTAPPRRGRR